MKLKQLRTIKLPIMVKINKFIKTRTIFNNDNNKMEDNNRYTNKMISMNIKMDLKS